MVKRKTITYKRNKLTRNKRSRKLIKKHRLKSIRNKFLAINIKNKKRTRKVIKRTKQKGGVWPFKKKAALEKAIKEVQQTEGELIKKHKSYARANMKFYDAYNGHIINLKKLDAFIPKLDSFQELFTDVVMPNDIKPNLKINMSNPLFVNQYNISEESTPRDISVEHIKQQIKYCMFKYFHPQDTKVITDVDVEFDETMITIVFTINNFKEIERKIQHIGYRLNMSELKASLETLIEEVKENVDYEYKPKKYSEQSILRIAPKHASAKGKKGANEIQLLGDSNESSNINHMIKGSQKAEIINTDDEELAKLLAGTPGQKLNNVNNSS